MKDESKERREDYVQLKASGGGRTIQTPTARFSARCHLSPLAFPHPSISSLRRCCARRPRQPCSPQEAFSAYLAGLSMRRRPRPSSQQQPPLSPARPFRVFPNSSSILLSLASLLLPPLQVCYLFAYKIRLVLTALASTYVCD